MHRARCGAVRCAALALLLPARALNLNVAEKTVQHLEDAPTRSETVSATCFVGGVTDDK